MRRKQKESALLSLARCLELLRYHLCRLFSLKVSSVASYPLVFLCFAYNHAFAEGLLPQLARCTVHYCAQNSP